MQKVVRDNLPVRQATDSYLIPPAPLAPIPRFRFWTWLRAWRISGRQYLRQRQTMGGFTRLSWHIGVLVAIVLMIALQHVRIPSFANTVAAFHTQSATVIQQNSMSGNEAALWYHVVPGSPVEGLRRENSTHTIIPERPREHVVTYIVQPGDTITGIAAKFHLKEQTIEWANGLELNPDIVISGAELIIPPVDGIVHVAEEGDTITKIAHKYKVKPETIVHYKPNKLYDVHALLRPHQTIIVPGGIKPYVVPFVHSYVGPALAGAAHGTGQFVWPATGRLTALFDQIVCSPMLGCVHHSGIDIANITGTFIKAADSGHVVWEGYRRDGYGRLIIINHGNGFSTYYAHLHVILVRRGQLVGRGQLIGRMGRSGNTTGAHLHFEIRFNNIVRNPLNYLPMEGLARQPFPPATSNAVSEKRWTKKEVENLVKSSQGTLPSSRQSCVYWAIKRRAKLGAQRLPTIGIYSSDLGAHSYIQIFKGLVIHITTNDVSGIGLNIPGLQPGAAIVWNKGHSDLGREGYTFGHIAIVEVVQPDGVWVSQANWPGRPVMFIPKKKLSGLYLIPPTATPVPKT